MPWFLVIRAASLSLNFQQVAHVLFFFLFFFSLLFSTADTCDVPRMGVPTGSPFLNIEDGQVGGPWTNE